MITFRSLAWFGLITFVPLWEVSLGHSKSYGNHVLAVMLLVGGVGTLVAGPIADRFGLRPVLMASIVAIAPLILVFVAGRRRPGAVALALVGACRDRDVRRDDGDGARSTCRAASGMASGLSIGFSIGLGGVAAVVARRGRRLGRPAHRALRLRGRAARRARADDAAPVRPGRARLEPEVASCSLGSDGNRQERAQCRRQRILRAASVPRRARQDRRDEQLLRLRHRRRRHVDGEGRRRRGHASTRATPAATARSRRSAETFEKVVKGEQNPTAAYMSGKLKIKGDMGAAMKLQKLF